jgi:hypothetical protein
MIYHLVTLGQPICRWEDNIKMDLRGTGWGSTDWINMAKDRDQRWALGNMVMKLPVPQNVGKFLSR